ncbi:hydrogenase maturation protein HypF [Photobacterium sp. SKA34]|uniref:carbamoyltransferase HypF n=1 Tax=Photobacterium sp. SKA34 TaxID=121723 RepID=UPI00006AF7FE|nr:carbamoyltransferase HypF [Photobacterium sp. SKA34]EAR54967.1 hydrogenase maturation protein HypF [Photobacterium sp. SKA34]
MADNIARQYIHITGIVQGVGFRPFVYQLATQYALVGSVINDSEGVKIDVQGSLEILATFTSQLIDQAPPLSRIDDVAIRTLSLWSELEKPNTFGIEQSQCRDSTTVSISPDQGLCDACKRDISNPDSRYFQYPFTNCTHCGPRYSIIKALPYDRVATSMQDFSLCPDCAEAYQNPVDRRYHAQPISCDCCGPWVTLYDIQQRVKSSAELPLVATKQTAIEQLAQKIKDGEIVAIKGIGGFHLMCDATNAQAVASLRRLKHRQSKPLAIMAASDDITHQLVEGSDAEWEALYAQARPIVLMKKRIDVAAEEVTRTDGVLAENVAPNVPYLGIMQPYTPLHYLLFDKLKEIDATSALVMTSANLSGMPIATELAQVCAQFSGKISGVLDHNRPIVSACDDSLVHYAGGKIRVLRMARGYAPVSYFGTGSEQSTGNITVALGAEQKSTIGLALPQQWLISPYIGNLDDLDTELRYQETVNHLTALYNVKPQQLVCDKHPNYHSSQFAEKYQSKANLAAPLLKVQHHHAHVLAVMAEHNITESVLGFTFDGTGWGDDHTVWGGEVLLSTPQSYQRVGHLRQFRLIGGEKAIKEPARLLFAILLEFYSVDAIKAMQLSAFKEWSDSYFNNLYRLWQTGSQSPYTSSMGRLIDAWTSLLGLVDRVDYEGECGLKLEQAAMKGRCHQPISFAVDANGVIDWQPLFEYALPLLSLVADDNRSAWRNCFAHSFISALADVIVTIGKAYKPLPIVLGGGVFQNRVLVDEVFEKASAHSLSIFCGEALPANDASIAAGQLWFAIHQK